MNQNQARRRCRTSLNFLLGKTPALAALLLAGASLLHANTARAQDDAVAVHFLAGDDLVPAAGRLATEGFPPPQRQALKDAGLVLLAYPLWINDHCAVDIGYALPAPAQRMARAPYVTGWAVSSQRAGEARAETCERAFAKAVENLRGADDVLSAIKLTSASDAPQADRKLPRNLPARPDLAHSYTSGLNDEANAAIAVLLGQRFTHTFDYRKFAAHVNLMAFKTMEGKEGCMVRAGLTARIVDGARYRVPAMLYTRYLERRPGAALCPRELLAAALADMAADALSESAYGTFAAVAEPGVKYPGRKELLAAQAAADRLEARKRQEVEAKQRKAASTVATTTARNAVRCSNHCVNGSCVRTFEDGRKERWQAPRVFRFGNWEWDTTSNACGG